MVLFVNEPPAYRETMSRAIGERTGLPVAALPLHSSLDDGIRMAGPALVVTSGNEDTAARLSRRISVINLAYGEEERATVYREGARVEGRSLRGLEDLAEMIRRVAASAR